MARRRPPTLLAALLCAAALAVAPAATAAVGDCTPSSAWPAAQPDLAAQVVSLVNAHRAALGLAPLAVSPTLTAAATWKARNMAAYDYLDHDDLVGPARTADERLAACGYPAVSWGENIAEGYTTAQAVVAGWLGSPGHRANIEDPDFRATGVAAAGAPLYWTQTFGSVVDPGSVVPAAQAPAPLAAPAPATAQSKDAEQAAPRTASTRSLRVTCAQRRQRIACRVHAARGAIVRLALRRSGLTFARARKLARADVVRVALRPMRRLSAGRYVLVARAEARERRLALTVR